MVEHKGPLESYATFAQPSDAPGGPDYKPEEEYFTTGMGKKELQDILINAYLSGDADILITQVWQERPNTFAIVNYLPGAYAEFGFAKCCGATKRNAPDKWDAAYGRDMAIRKAIGKLAKRLATEVKEKNE